MATIYEVARLAGVSPATVSRVFNGATVSEARTRAVRQAAEQLRFVPNRTARSLRRQRSEVLALIIPDIENPYFTELARGVEDVAQRAGYSLVMCNTDANADKETRYLQIAISERMAGVIIAPASTGTDITVVLADGRPVVTVDRHLDHAVDEVVMANHEAGRTATESLVRAGYQRIACISGPERVETARQRVHGWFEVMSEHHLGPMPSDYVVYAAFDVRSGRQEMERLLALAEPPDAVVAANNLIGVGAIQVLTEHRLTPPRVGVAVIGSLPFSTLSPRAVTIVNLPARRMGETAAQMVLQRVGGDTRPPRAIVLPSTVQPATATPE